MFALVLGATAAAFAAGLGQAALDNGRVPLGAGLTGPVGLLGLLGLLAIALLWRLRRGDTAALVGGLFGWSLGVHGALDLPIASTNLWYADGPHGAPLVLALGIAAGLFAAAGPRPWSGCDRLLAVALFATTGSANLFSRSSDGIFHLIGAAVLAHIALAPPRRVESPLGRAVAALALALVLWVFAAAYGSEDTSLGHRVALRVAVGALLGWTLLRNLDRASVRRMASVLGFGVAAALFAVGADLLAAAQTEPWQRILGSRLRGLGMHPNGLGPLWAFGAVLALGLGFGQRGAARIAWIALLALSLLALGLTQSRAASLGVAVGLGFWALAQFAPAPSARRLWTALGAALGLFALGSMALLARFAPKLDALAWTQSALGQRWHFWRTSARALADHPLLGLGPNQSFLRAQYAEPSFYDGTPQDLHPHQLFLALAEGAGWPALVLVLALAALALEATRRALARGRAPHVAALLGSAAAVFASNQLDLGLSQNTFVPLWFWIALGLLVAEGAPAAPAPAPPGPRTGGFLAAPALGFAALGLVFHPLAAALLAARGEAFLDGGKAARAEAPILMLERISQGDGRAAVLAVRAARAKGQSEQVLALREERCRRSPGRASAWHVLAEEALAMGDTATAARAAERARALDPRGARAGELAYLEAALCFARGDEAGGRERIRSAMLLASSQLSGVPHVILEPQAEDPPRVRRRAALVGGGTAPRPLPWTEILAPLGQEALDLAETDPVLSRRLLKPVVEAYGAMGMYEAALDLLAAHRARTQSPFPSVATIEVEYLGRTGRWDEARALLPLSRGEPHLRIALAAAELARPEREQRERSLAQLDEDLKAIHRADLFFTAGTLRPSLELFHRLTFEAGRFEPSFQLAERTLREWGEPGPRQRFAKEVALAFQRPDVPLALRARALTLYARELSLTPRAARAPNAFSDLLRAYRQAGPEAAEPKGAALRRALSPFGSAEGILWAAWNS